MDQTISQRRYAPFAWGAQDCLMFAADCVAESTGTDPAESMRGYATEADGYARLSRLYGDLVAFWDAHADRIGVGYMRKGDVAVVDLNGYSTAVFDGARLVGPGHTGLTHIRPSRALYAWRPRCHQ